VKRIAILLSVALLCTLVMAGCGCKHETWKEADCVNPKTCAECGKTEGEALGHSWKEADCETPKTCAVCEKTEGEALGHSWKEADCETPKTCSACEKTEGEALGHTWKDATTEAPKTCSACDKTEGERIITDPRFTTAACSALFGDWVWQVPIDGEMMDLDGFTEVFYMDYRLSFSNDGKMSITTKLQKPTEFTQAIRTYMISTIYAGFIDTGMSRAEADKAMQDAYGMTVEGYVDYYMQVVNFSGMFEIPKQEGTYYVNGNQIYVGQAWQDMESQAFSIQDGKLEIDGIAESMGAAKALFEKVK